MRLATCVLLLTCAACAQRVRLPWDVAQDSTHRVVTISGLSGPEAVRYDPDQDVYFISNFNGEPAGDANGFITRARADGTIDSLRFMVGTSASPMHGPRGMFLTADTLWVADADGVHHFHRSSEASRRTRSGPPCPKPSFVRRRQGEEMDRVRREGRGSAQGRPAAHERGGIEVMR